MKVAIVVERGQLGPNRYRESFGRHLEDFKVGDIYEHRPGRTTGRKAGGTASMSYERTILVPKCGHAVDDC